MSGLQDLSVFLDFECAVMAEDPTQVLLDRYVPGPWRDVEAAFARGERSSRERIIELWEALRGVSESLAIDEVAAVPLDPHVGPLCSYLTAGRAEVTIVSDGLGLLVADVAAGNGVHSIGNAIDWSTGELLFPNEDRCCPCSSCGTCKQAPIKDAQAQGRWTVMVSDRTSDIKAALLADVIFAQGALADWCVAFDVAFRPYASLADVHEGIEDLV